MSDQACRRPVGLGCGCIVVMLLTIGTAALQAAPTIQLNGPRASTAVRSTPPTRDAAHGLQHSAARLLRKAFDSDPTLTPQARESWFRGVAADVQQLANAHQCTAPHDTQDFLHSAEALFQQLHRKWLSGEFRPGCARLQVTLESGDYNCLTSTLIYIALCRQAGLPAAALATPQHVSVVLQANDAVYAIETTSLVWHPVPQPHDPGRRLTDQQLVARLHYNLAIELAEKADYAAAVRSAESAWRLDPYHAAARANWLATLNNWTIELIEQRRDREAMQLIDQGLGQSPDYGPLRRARAFLTVE